jgi:hypothetical protein
VATLAAVFDHVTVIAPPDLLDDVRGGNFVLAASDAPFDAGRLQNLIHARAGQEEVLTDGGAVAFAGNGTVLTDDYAPVDQWLARSRRTAASSSR